MELRPRRPAGGWQASDAEAAAALMALRGARSSGRIEGQGPVSAAATAGPSRHVDDMAAMAHSPGPLRASDDREEDVMRSGVASEALSWTSSSEAGADRVSDVDQGAVDGEWERTPRPVIDVPVLRDRRRMEEWEQAKRRKVAQWRAFWAWTPGELLAAALL